MKVAWIYPRSKRCGVSFYSEKYLTTLRGLVEITAIDTEEILNHLGSSTKRADSCDLVHIQYETSLFLRGHRDYFASFVKSILRPVITSVHEIYRSFPGVFPRENIRGGAITRTIRSMMYDLRHPVVSILSTHVRHSFLSQRVLVHSGFQKEILIEKGVDPLRLRVLPHPVRPPMSGHDVRRLHTPVKLVSTGFVNPLYDSDLLVETLSLLPIPWTFTWIGGPRRPEDSRVQDELTSAIKSRGWHDRFTITGWVEDSERDRLLSESDLYCAFFRDRSSSESIATALEAGCLIIATPIALTRDLAASGALHVAGSDALSMSTALQHLLSDVSSRSQLAETSRQYAQSVSYEKMATQLVSLYEEVVR